METGYFAHPVRARDVKVDDLMVLFGIDHRIVETARLGTTVLLRLEPVQISHTDHLSPRTVELRTDWLLPMKVFYKDK